MSSSQCKMVFSKENISCVSLQIGPNKWNKSKMVASWSFSQDQCSQTFLFLRVYTTSPRSIFISSIKYRKENVMENESNLCFYSNLTMLPCVNIFSFFCFESVLWNRSMLPLSSFLDWKKQTKNPSVNFRKLPLKYQGAVF